MSFTARPRGSRWRRRIVWLAIGLALGAGVGVLYKMRRPSEPLTLAGLEQAREQWEQVAPEEYAMHIEVRGAQHGQHRIELRDGIVRMTTGGAAVNEDTAERWSVEGLFQFLETELDNVNRAKELYNVEPERVVLRVHYDPRFSYPAYFHRHVPGGVKDVEWIVRAFEVGGK